MALLNQRWLINWGPFIVAVPARIDILFRLFWMYNARLYIESSCSIVVLHAIKVSMPFITHIMLVIINYLHKMVTK